MKTKPHEDCTSGSFYAGGSFDIPGSLGSLEAPYPRQYERHIFSGNGTLLLIRPIKPQDAPLLEDFLKCLSPETVFHRFMTYLRTLSPEWVEHFTRIDLRPRRVVGSS